MARTVVLHEWHTHRGASTCPVCASLEGKRFTPETGPIPPMHPGCRCTRDPVLVTLRTAAETVALGVALAAALADAPTTRYSSERDPRRAPWGKRP